MDARNTRGGTLAAAAALAALMVTSCDLIPGGDDEPAQEEQNGTGNGAEDNGAADNGEDPGQDGATAGEPDEEAFASAEISDVVGNSVGEARFSEAGEDGVLVDVELWDVTPGFRALTIHEAGVCEPQSYNEAGELGDYYSSGDVLAGDGSGETGVVEGEDELETEDPDEGDEDPDDAGPDGLDNGEGTDADGTGTGGDDAGTSLDDYPEGTVEGQAVGQITGTEQAEEEDEILHPERAGDLPNVFIMESGDAQMSFVTDRLSEGLITGDEGTSIILRAEPTHHGSLPERYAPYGPDQMSQATGDLGARTACGVIE
ncbi:superoxide dismutase family protein [Nesterenkonia populi]